MRSIRSNDRFSFSRLNEDQYIDKDDGFLPNQVHYDYRLMAHARTIKKIKNSRALSPHQNIIDAHSQME